jgi:NAD(P)-dependent dehydrogenase (short-subunit alcohol dehydrogenase family)
MMQLKDQAAVITGAGSGIGRATAISLARRGAHLALADVNEAGLAETATQAGAHGVRVTTHRLDVADPAAVAAFPTAVNAEHPSVGLLFNNAGVALGGNFEEVSAADFEWLFGVNFWGVVRMTRAFLPLLRQAKAARIVNISSMFGLIAPPGQVAYSASKFAVRGFSEALRHELAGSNVGVTQVHPGGVATRIAMDARRSSEVSPAEQARQQARFARLLKMPPEQAGEIIVGGVEREQDRILVGSDAKIGDLAARLFPVGYWKWIARITR